jgi:GlpG protein
MYWLIFLGRQIEYRYGSWRMLALVILIAIPSNIMGALVPAEFDGIGIADLGTYWTIGMGGMSGVVYGLLGYVWIKMLFEPQTGLQISASSVAVLMVWLLICMAPGFEDWFGFKIANWAHGVGLAVGLAIAYWPKLLSDMGMGSKSDGTQS